MNINIAIVI